MEQILVCRICVKNQKLINISKTIPVKNGSKWSKDLFINIKEKLSYAYGITIDRKNKFNMVCINCIRIVNNVVLLKLQAVEAKRFLEDIQIMFKPGSSISSQDIVNLYEKMKRTINTSKFEIPTRKRKNVAKKSGFPSTPLYGQYRNPNNKFVKKGMKMQNDEDQSIDTQQLPTLMEKLSQVESNDCLTVSNSNECAKTNKELSSLNSSTPSKENICKCISACFSNNSLKYVLNNSMVLNEISEKSSHVLVTSSVSDPLHCNKNAQICESKNNNNNNKRFLINDTIPNNTESKLSRTGSGRCLNKSDNQNSYEGPDFTTKDNDSSQSECFIRIESVESLHETESKITNSDGFASSSLFTTNKRTDLILSDKNNVYLEDSSSRFSSSPLGSSTFNIMPSNQASDEPILPPIFVEASSKQIYLCDYCPKNFTSNIYLKRHIRNIHLFSCPACKKSFNTQKHLNRHIKIKSCSMVGDKKTEPKAVDWKLYLKPIVRLVATPAFVSTNTNLSK